MATIILCRIASITTHFGSNPSPMDRRSKRGFHHHLDFIRIFFHGGVVVACLSTSLIIMTVEGVAEVEEAGSWTHIRWRG